MDLRGDFEASRLIGCLKSSGFGSEYSNHGARMRRIRFRCIEKSKNRTCSESNSGRPILTSKSAQNGPGTLIIGFALKNPKVVSDRQNAGRMPSKRRFWHFRPIRENPGLNVNLKWSPWICEGSRRDPRPFKVFHPNRSF